MQIPVKSALFFSESKDILWWIRGRGRDFRAFVANRGVVVGKSMSDSFWYASLVDGRGLDGSANLKNDAGHERKIFS